MHETKDEAPKQYQCRHIFTDGRRCASPCLRQEEFCYYHHTTRKPVADPRQRRSRSTNFQLPLPEDRFAIQSSIGEVLQRIASNDIDPRRAGLLLYGLQIASRNLAQSRPATKASVKRENPEPETVEEIIIDPTLGVLAPRAEVSKPTARKSPITELIEKLIQDQQTEADSTATTVLPTVQATEAMASDDILIQFRTSLNQRNSAKHEPTLIMVPTDRRTLNHSVDIEQKCANALFSLKSLSDVLFLPAYEVPFRVTNPNRLPASTPWVSGFNPCHYQS